MLLVRWIVHGDLQIEMIVQSDGPTVVFAVVKGGE